MWRPGLHLVTCRGWTWIRSCLSLHKCQPPPAQPATSHESLSLDTLAVMGAPAAPGPGTSLGQVSYFCSVQAGLQDHHWHHTASRIACIIDIRASGSHVKVWDVLAGERCHARPCALTHSSAAGRWLAAR